MWKNNRAPAHFCSLHRQVRLNSPPFSWRKLQSGGGSGSRVGEERWFSNHWLHQSVWQTCPSILVQDTECWVAPDAFLWVWMHTQKMCSYDEVWMSDVEFCSIKLIHSLGSASASYFTQRCFLESLSIKIRKRTGDKEQLETIQGPRLSRPKAWNTATPIIWNTLSLTFHHAPPTSGSPAHLSQENEETADN